MSRLWIDPTGGLGDMLLLSGVLRTRLARRPDERFALIRRKTYGSFLAGHPAIAEVGHPPSDAAILSTAYWCEEGFHETGMRAYQALARRFGLSSPVPEELWLPGELPSAEDLLALLPSDRPRVALCPFSQSPRKEIPPPLRIALARALRDEGVTVVQFGRRGDPPIPGVFSLVGLTRPREALALLKHVDLVVAADNFFQHGAALLGLPAVVLWGPTRPEVYGWPGHEAVRGGCRRGIDRGCLVPGCGADYVTPCPAGPEACLAALPLEALLAPCLSKLGQIARRRS